MVKARDDELVSARKKAEAHDGEVDKLLKERDYARNVADERLGKIATLETERDDARNIVREREAQLEAARLAMQEMKAFATDDTDSRRRIADA